MPGRRRRPGPWSRPAPVHFAIVDHLEGNAAPSLAQLEEETPARAPRTDRAARPGKASRLEPHCSHRRPPALPPMASTRGKLRGRAPERIVDAIEVILRIGLRAGVQATSSLKTTSPLATAAHLRSLAPRSNRCGSHPDDGQRAEVSPFQGKRVEGDVFHFHGAAVDALTMKWKSKARAPWENTGCANRRRCADRRRWKCGIRLLPEQKLQQALA